MYVGAKDFLIFNKTNFLLLIIIVGSTSSIRGRPMDGHKLSLPEGYVGMSFASGTTRFTVQS